MRSIKNVAKLSDKKILLRLDLNVPLADGKILDTTRIDKILPTLNFLLKQNSKIIIISHVGRPKGKFINELSLNPISEELQKKLKENVRLVSKNINLIPDKNFFNEYSEKIIILENIRFYPEEEQNNLEFAKHLARLGDIYVNDAFSCSHRSHASIDVISKFLPCYSGLQMDLEVHALNKITLEINRPISCIIGGSKISTKINVIKNLVSKFDNIIIVGAMANNIIEYLGYNIGKSIKEENSKKIIYEIISLSKKESCKLYFPEDVVVSDNINGTPQVKLLKNIASNEMILDIGPNTVKNVKKIIYSVAGGGDTVSLLNKLDAVNNFNFVSTAGGAFLEYLEGNKLPGISALNQNVRTK